MMMDESRNRSTNFATKKKRAEEEARKSKKRVCIIQNGTYRLKTQKVWNALVKKAKASYYCDLTKVHQDASVGPQNLPNEDWDVVIYMEKASDFEEKSVTDLLGRLRGEKKLVILLHFSSDVSQPKLKPSPLTTYKGANIFNFMGGEKGLHPVSQWQKEQESAVLDYITA